MARPFTVPLIYKLAGSDFNTLLNLQGGIYCCCVFFFVSRIVLIIRRIYLRVYIIPLLYFVFSWWNIVGWVNQGLSEFLCFSFFLLWLSFILLFLQRPNILVFIFLIVITVLFSFTRDTNPYFIVVTSFLLLFLSLTKQQFTIGYFVLYAFISIVLFFIQQKTVDTGERYRLSLYHNITLRVSKNSDYLNWFKERGLPLTDLIQSNFKDFNPKSKEDVTKLYQTYNDSTYKPVFDWITNGGKKMYITFLLTHPEYLMLLDQSKKERERIFCYNLIPYIGGGFHGYFQIPNAILPLFNIWFMVLFFVLLMYFYFRSASEISKYIIPILLTVLTTCNIFLSYNAEAMEVERHMMFNRVCIEIMAWISLFILLEKYLDSVPKKQTGS